ncbi:MAG TPA: hypothetical protein VFA32_22365 [Dehalococcoidia bacterium]|jgi:hypothetical protein|nr:hypothetical protein [Dehalococcoidia bacterium]
MSLVLRGSLLLVWGVVNQQDGTMNIVVQQARSLKGVRNPPRAKNWS